MKNKVIDHRCKSAICFSQYSWQLLYGHTAALPLAIVKAIFHCSRFARAGKSRPCEQIFKARSARAGKATAMENCLNS
jgi:hypothetical protein